MKKINLSKIVIGLILLTWISCKDEPPAPQEDLGFLSLGEAKDYMLFKQGTWWIYKNSLTQELDTMVLTSCSLDTFSASNSKRKFTYEDIAYTIKSRRNDVTYLYYSNGLTPEGINFNKNWVWRRELQGTGIVSSQTTILGILYPFYNGTLNGETECKGKLDTLSVSNKLFNNIVEFDIERQDNSFPMPKNFYILEGGNSKYYYAKNYGLIKIEHQSWDAPSGGNMVYMNWDLIQANIVK